MPDPEITVAIPTRNRLPYLKQAISSVLEQEADLELLVIDDQSDDGTREWLTTGLQDPRVVPVLLMQHAERSVARNTGLERARGEFVMLLYDDDRLADGALTALSDAMKNDPRTIAAVGATVYFDEKGNQRRLEHPFVPITVDVSDEVMLGWPVHPGCTLFRTSTAREVGGFPVDSVPIEDQDFWLRIAERGPVAILPQTVLHYRRHAQYRAPDTYANERLIRERFIATLKGERRERAETVHAARLLRHEGIEAWRQNDLATAYVKFRAAVETSPYLTESPFSGRRMRSLLLRTSAGRILGPRATALAQRAVWLARKITRRAPGGPDPLLPVDAADNKARR